MTGWGMVCGISSIPQRTRLHGITLLCWMLLVMGMKAFGNGDEGISDMPAFKEFEKCVCEMFGDVKV